MTATSDSTTHHLTVQHDGVTIPVSRGGRGRPLVLCPGLNCTQADLHELIDLLRRDHDVVAFDLRGHGLSSAAERYTFDAFLGDLRAVMRELELLSPPLLVGYSLGADLAVHYAAECADTVAGLVLIDGANPLPEPFVTDIDLAEFREMARQTVEQSKGRERARQVVLSAEEVFELGLEMDGVRAGILDRYRKVDGAVRMVMSSAIAGRSGAGRAPRHNRLWRDGVERLVRERANVSVSWLDADHRLVFTHAPDIAEIVRSAHQPVGGPAS
ncbi:alpha/beta fold hydrolase [Streptomyces sp. NPDC057099]|uniref:alpha/beta fold hydrolase n=1 Tax=Streptomyces sp. NPDC057099 TaxID=3346019 RepID=UPI00363ED319